MGPPCDSYAHFLNQVQNQMGSAMATQVAPSIPPPQMASFVPVGNNGHPVEFSSHELSAMGARYAEHHARASLVNSKHPYAYPSAAAPYAATAYERAPPFEAPPMLPRHSEYDPFGYAHFPAAPQEYAIQDYPGRTSQPVPNYRAAAPAPKESVPAPAPSPAPSSAEADLLVDLLSFQ